MEHSSLSKSTPVIFEESGGPDAPLSLADIKKVNISAKKVLHWKWLYGRSATSGFSIAAEALALSGGNHMARNERKHGRALQFGRPLTNGLLQERTTRGSLSAECLSNHNSVDLDGEQLNFIPPAICQSLQSIAHLNLTHNYFTDMTCFSSLTSLSSLKLSHNCITQVSGISRLAHLIELDLSNNLIPDLDASDLPTQLQNLQVQGNPLKTSQRRLFATLAFTLPSLRHLNERVLPPPESSADTGSRESTESSDMVEAALTELQGEEDVLPAIVSQLIQAPRRSTSLSNLERLGQKQPRLSEDGISPVRVTPAVSRQASADLSCLTPSSEALEVLARVREALPRLREAADVGIDKTLLDNLGLGMASRQSLNSDYASRAAFRRMHSDGARGSTRAISMPPMGDRSLRSGQHPTSKPTAKFPLISNPPNYSEKPAEFRNLLGMAISTLLGSGGPPRESISVPDGGESDVWAQTQLHRQQVLDSLFSKRTLKGKLSGEGTSGKGNQQESDDRSHGPKKGRTPLRRADSTISKNRRGRSGSIVNEEMLRGLDPRDAPRAESLSEALQGPPIQSPGDQLAALSQSPSERITAENVRLSLRRGIEKMLDSMQNQRLNEPAAVAAMAEELMKLIKLIVFPSQLSSGSGLSGSALQMKSLQRLLAVKGGHMPPQPQVLASIVGSHSRLGSITDRLAQTLHTPSPASDPGAEAALATASSVHAHKTPAGTDIQSPFDVHPEKADNGAARVHHAAHQQEDKEQPSVAHPGTSTSSSTSLSSSEAGPKSQAGRRQTTPAMPALRRPDAAGPQRNPSQRRRPQQPSSPGSDTEPEPPADRQSARPIFGGIAKMVRNPSGQLELPPSPVPGSLRAPSARSLAGKPKKTASAGKLHLNIGHKPHCSGPPPAKPPVENESEPEPEKKASSLPHRQIMSRAQTSHPSLQPQKAEHGIKSASTYEPRSNAEDRDAQVQSELWERFSGRVGSSMPKPKLDSDPDGLKKGIFSSPFSAANTVSASPFSKAATIEEAEPLSRRGKSWHVGNDAKASPFSRTALAGVERPSQSALEIESAGYSAPAMPASEIELRVQQAADFAKAEPESFSAPPEGNLCEAMQEAIGNFEKEKAAKEEATVAKARQVQKNSDLASKSKLKLPGSAFYES